MTHDTSSILLFENNSILQCLFYRSQTIILQREIKDTHSGSINNVSVDKYSQWKYNNRICGLSIVMDC